MKPSKALPAAIAASLLFAGCLLNTVRYFDLTKEHFTLKGRTIAVIVGSREELNVFFADQVAEALAKRSTFRVLSQSEIVKADPAYPQNIRGPYTSAYFDVETDYTNTDVARLKDLSRRLGADYLFVIWVPTTYASNHGRFYNVVEVAQLFEFPSGEEVGSSQLRIPVTREEKSGCFCFAPRYYEPGPEELTERIRREADNIARDIAEKTGTAKRAETGQKQ